MGPIVWEVNIGWDLATTDTRWRAEPTLCLTFDMRLVEAGLRGYGAARAHVDIAGNHHALVTPITAELQPLLPPGSYRAGHGRPARMPQLTFVFPPEPRECKGELTGVDPSRGSHH